MKKNIGVNVKPPEKECDDARCAWHGRLAIRGRIFRGVVKSVKTHNTAVVEWGYDRYVPKYERYERRKSRVTAHNPDCIHARENDVVVVAECRPLSKTKSFVVIGKTGQKVIEVKGEDLKELVDREKEARKKVKIEEKEESSEAEDKEKVNKGE